MLAFLFVWAMGQTLPVSALAPRSVSRLDGHTQIIPLPNRTTVLIFVGTECPVANRYAPEIQRLTKANKVNARFVLIYVKGTDRSAASKHAAAFGYLGLTAVDEGGLLVRATGVTATPEAVVIDAKGRVRYRGRIDDINSSHGTTRPAARRRYLQAALDSVARGKAVATPITSPIGCPIEF